MIEPRVLCAPVKKSAKNPLLNRLMLNGLTLDKDFVLAGQVALKDNSSKNV